MAGFDPAISLASRLEDHPVKPADGVLLIVIVLLGRLGACAHVAIGARFFE